MYVSISECTDLEFALIRGKDIKYQEAMSVVATLGVIKKYFQGKSGTDVSTTILKLHRYHFDFSVCRI